MRSVLSALILAAILVGCSTGIAAQKDNPAAIGAFLTELNQKVTGYMYGQDIPADFDIAQYKEIVFKVCDHPACQEKSAALFNDYEIKARKVDGFFSVMLCDPDTRNKVMEDYSCNNMKVEVRSWEAQTPEDCRFAENWQEIYEKECK